MRAKSLLASDIGGRFDHASGRTRYQSPAIGNPDGFEAQRAGLLLSFMMTRSRSIQFAPLPYATFWISGSSACRSISSRSIAPRSTQPILAAANGGSISRVNAIRRISTGIASSGLSRTRRHPGRDRSGLRHRCACSTIEKAVMIKPKEQAVLFHVTHSGSLRSGADAAEYSIRQIRRPEVSTPRAKWAMAGAAAFVENLMLIASPVSADASYPVRDQLAHSALDRYDRVPDLNDALAHALGSASAAATGSARLCRGCQRDRHAARAGPGRTRTGATLA